MVGKKSEYTYKFSVERTLSESRFLDGFPCLIGAEFIFDLTLNPLILPSTELVDAFQISRISGEEIYRNFIDRFKFFIPKLYNPVDKYTFIQKHGDLLLQTNFDDDQLFTSYYGPIYGLCTRLSN